MAAMTAAVSTAVLKNVPLLASFPDEQLRVLTAVVNRRSVPRGTVVMAAGDPTDSLYIVISGRLKVMMSDAEGKEVILSLLGAGEYFGEMGLIDDSPRSASVVSIEPCELLAIAKRDFKRCLAENFEMATAVMRGLVRRLREADRKIGSLALLDVYGRGGAPADRHVGKRRRADDRHPQDRQTGHCQDDRRLARDGEPGDEGLAERRLHRNARLEHCAA